MVEQIRSLQKKEGGLLSLDEVVNTGSKRFYKSNRDDNMPMHSTAGWTASPPMGYILGSTFKKGRPLSSASVDVISHPSLYTN